MSFVSKVRQANPLVHNITNIVVANFTANGLLALGASRSWPTHWKRWRMLPRCPGRSC